MSYTSPRGAQPTSRSPNYPAYDLERSLKFLASLYNEAHWRYVSCEDASEYFGFSRKSSNGYRVIATLRQFGLLEEKGAGTERQVRIAGAGLRVLQSPAEDPGEYQELLQEAALAPDIYRDLWERWNGQLPPRLTLANHLITECDFNRDVVNTVINDFEGTLVFAGLSEGLPTERPRTGANLRLINGHAVEASGEPLDLSVPLANGSRVVIKIPIPLTESEYNWISGLIQANLEVLKQHVVKAGDARPFR